MLHSSLGNDNQLQPERFPVAQFNGVHSVVHHRINAKDTVYYVINDEWQAAVLALCLMAVVGDQ